MSQTPVGRPGDDAREILVVVASPIRCEKLLPVRVPEVADSDSRCSTAARTCSAVNAPRAWPGMVVMEPIQKAAAAQENAFAGL